MDSVDRVTQGAVTEDAEATSFGVLGASLKSQKRFKQKQDYYYQLQRYVENARSNFSTSFGVLSISLKSQKRL